MCKKIKSLSTISDDEYYIAKKVLNKVGLHMNSNKNLSFLNCSKVLKV